MGDERREVRRLAASVAAFLRSSRAAAGLEGDAAEALVVAAQCVETSFGFGDEPASPPPPDLFEAWRRGGREPTDAVPPPPPAFSFGGAFSEPPPPPPQISPENKARADELKNEGNRLMKSERYAEALEKYTEAIALDAGNAIFFCNRAAAHSAMKNDEAAIEDCKRALCLNPKYGRAYGRLGLALANLDRHVEAREAYRIACQLEPDNEAYRNNLAVTEEALRRTPNATGAAAAAAFPINLDLSQLLQSQSLANFATQMLSDPGLQALMSRLVGGEVPPQPQQPQQPPQQPPSAAPQSDDQNRQQQTPLPSGLDALLQAGQQLAEQMQQANPEFVERLRRQMQQSSRQNPQPKPPQ